jgi:hypothetical protein
MVQTMHQSGSELLDPVLENALSEYKLVKGKAD